MEDFPGERLSGEEISRLAERFSSWDWKYGRQIPFSKETEERFSWGEMRIQLRVDGGRIQETRLFTDALDVELTERAEKCLSGQVDVYKRQGRTCRYFPGYPQASPEF